MTSRAAFFVLFPVGLAAVGCTSTPEPNGPRGSGIIAPLADILGIPVGDASDPIDLPPIADAGADAALAADADVVDAPDVTDARDVIDAADVADARDVLDAVVAARDATQDAPPPDVASQPDVTLPVDPVSYSGSLPVRVEPRAFITTLRVLGNRRDVWVRLPATLRPGAPLMLAFHGTNSDGQTFLNESGAGAVAESRGAVFLAPSARWFGDTGADFDHPGGNGTYWETANNPNPETNEDLVLVRALIQEARRAYGVDPARVYAYGHSNGGFMAYFVAQILRDRVVGFGENAAGLSLTSPHQLCRFQGTGTTCAALATQPGWCPGGAMQLPVALPATGRVTPAVLFHGTADPVVSVFHTCTLDRLLRARGGSVQTTLFDGGGHAAFDTFAQRVFDGLSGARLSAP
ncbi:MAG: prolyl oligopeptidase family serine peptidase [Polyangiales bacterium]